jgi:hypothetical protein
VSCEPSRTDERFNLLRRGRPLISKVKNSKSDAKLPNSFLLWNCFDRQRTIQEGGDAEQLERSFFNMTLGGDCSDFEALAAIAAKSSVPFSVSRVADLLKEHRHIRGLTFWSPAGTFIDRIVGNYVPNMRWWMSKDGLVIEVVNPDAATLSKFDQVAGKLTLDRMADGRLSRAEFVEIAGKLDAERFELMENLEPKPRRKLAEHNQKSARKSNGTRFKTFADVASNPNFCRLIRQRLYRARDRYKKAYRDVATPTMHISSLPGPKSKFRPAQI